MHSIHFLFCVLSSSYSSRIHWVMTDMKEFSCLAGAVGFFLYLFTFYFLRFNVWYFSMFQCSFHHFLSISLSTIFVQLFFLNIVHKTMPCRHASKPWHGDGSVTSPYIYTLLTVNVWICLCVCVYRIFFLQTRIFPYCYSLLFWLCFFSFLYLFSILLMFSNTTLARHAIRL